MTEWPHTPLEPADAARVRAVGVFSPLTPDALAVLLEAAVVVTIPPFRVVFEQEQPASSLVVVVAGTVGLMAGIGPHAACLIELLGPGQVLGEAGVFDTGHYPVGAQTITEARLVLIPAAALLACLDSHPGLRRQMLGFLSARLRVLVRQLAQLKLMPAAQRVGSFLLGLAERRAGVQTIRLACERRIIAGMLGMTPECLSRSLRVLRDLGIRGQGKRDIVIEDVERLRRFTVGDGAEG